MTYKPRGTKEKPRRPPGQSRASSPIRAPVGLEGVQAFLNAVNVRAGSDELATPRDLAAWLSRNALLPAGVELSEMLCGRGGDAFDLRGGLV